MFSVRSQQAAKVLVVGSGPAGLIAALSLLKNGVPVRVIEKDKSHHTGERGASIQPRTAEIEYFLGAGDVYEAGVQTRVKKNIIDPKDPYHVLRTFHAVDEVEPTPSQPICVPTMLGQSDHQTLLRKHIEALGGSVELATALKKLSQDEKGVSATMTKATKDQVMEDVATFDYVIGADGARGTVRKELEIDTIKLPHQDMSAYLVDAFLEGFDLDGYTSFGDARSDSVGLRSTNTNGLYQIIISLGTRDFERLSSAEDLCESFQAEIIRISKRKEIRVKSIKWHGVWKANVRMAKTFRKGRVFLVGDAAHSHTPAGGQGLNSSVQDSFNLAWKLALALKCQAKPSVIDSYCEEREPVIAEMLNLTTEKWSKQWNEGTAAGLREGQSQGAENRKFLQLGINYRWSDIVFDERFVDEKTERQAYGFAGQAIRAGDRAPDAPELECLYAGKGLKAVSRILDVFNATQHVALIFSDGTANASAALLNDLSKFPDGCVMKVLIIPAESKYDATANTEVDYVLRDVEGHAFEGYGIDKTSAKPSVVIVRPDAYVGAYAISASGIEKYISLLF